MLKKGLSVFVLALFLAHFAGFYIYFIFQLNKNRQEMRLKLRELPADQLTLIMLSQKEYAEAKVEELEIKVDGKMFDIARVDMRYDIVLVYCIHDEAEDNILAFLDKVLVSPLNDDQAESMMQFFTLNYLPTYWNFLTPRFCEENRFTAYTEFHSSPDRENVIPPPKI